MGGSGIPIFHRDGPMRRTGDLGCLPIPDIGGVWRDVDLLSLPGAMLPNLMTARSTNDSYRGLVCASTQQKEILRALFRSAVLGIPDGAEGTAKHVMTDADADTLADAIAGKSPFILADNLLLELGESPSYATWKPDGIHTNGNLKEDAIRGIFDWLTFRQNVFIVSAAAQVVPPGGAGVLAEQRCVAIVCRDAFTGACRIRSVRPVWR
jgi:hypothetical protein